MLKFGRADWRNAARGEEQCFLLTNGLGGYCSMTVTGALTRDDHALLMGVLKAPNFRYHYITNVQEKLIIGNKTYDLASQSYVTRTKNQEGFRFLMQFSYEELPEWIYQVRGVTICKSLVMVHEQNTIGIRYQVHAPEGTEARLEICPLLKFAEKNRQPRENQLFELDSASIRSDGKILYFKTNGQVHVKQQERICDLYFGYDARDGRDSVGTVVTNHEILFEINGGAQDFVLAYSDQPSFCSVEEMMRQEKERLNRLDKQAGFFSPAAHCLVRSADQFLVKRESTGGDTIIAGYPFFGDWGRDTMIAVLGCAIASRQYSRARSILATFASYCKKGLMPNLFPEGEDAPMYNTVDASLWFFESVYEYGKASGDWAFVREMIPVMEEIVFWYQKGTDFHIFMDEDGLISAGEGYEQVTWMDVRFEEILPTSRHGKPVEVNALWYNALCILAELSPGKEQEYKKLAEKVKQSFQEKFWMEERGCLKDILSLEEERRYADTQIRCNQVWALSLSFCMVDESQAVRILDTIERELYTPYGLRSLAPGDPQFHPFCRGSQYERDMAYHQGTVWGFPLGAYLMGLLRWKEPKEAIRLVKEKLSLFEQCLREGCIGQVAEIYDGADPCESRGCFAQAWSVGEMLRVYGEIERRERI